MINLQDENNRLKRHIQELSLKLEYANKVIKGVHELNNIPFSTYQDCQTFLNSGGIAPKFGFIVYPNNDAKVAIIIDEMADIQSAVDGYFEFIEENDSWIVYANEDGLSKQMEPNPHASFLIERDVMLVGPVLFLFKNN